MLDELVRLLEIQRLDQKLERLDAKLAEIPQGLAAVEADLLKKRTRLDTAVTRIADNEKKKKKLELEIEDGKSRAGKLHGQLMNIKTNQEYRAMLTQIQSIHDQGSDKETEILMILEGMDQVLAEKAEATSEFQTFEGKAKHDLTERKKHGDVLQRDREETVAKRSELAGSLEKRLITLYERIRKKLGNNVVVELHGEICGGCHLSLRPQHANSVKEAKEVLTCEYCYRMLYVPDKPREEDEQQEDAS